MNPGTSWGPYGVRDGERQCPHRVIWGRIQSGISRKFLRSLLLGVKGSQVQILSSRRCEGSSRARACGDPLAWVGSGLRG